jgi:hypothetical protein
MLLNIEKIIWKHLVEVATLQADVEDAVESLLNQIPWDQLESLGAQDHVRIWFARGKSFYFFHCISN